MTSTKSQNKIIVLCGPTGTGKSALTLELAKHLDIEIVSADAVQIYRGLDLGSAKPNAAIQQQIKHHLIDICAPNEIYSAGRYIGDATQAVKDILSRNKVPLIVGGTMFYIKALLDGLNKLPSADSSLRQTYLNKYADLPEELQSAALHKELHTMDEVAAARINPADIHRVIRALELIEQSGTTLTKLFDEQEGTIKGLKDLASDNSWQITKFALNYQEREILRQKIAERFHQFIASGLIDEVKQLRRDYPDLDLSFPARRAIGYRQVWEYLLELDENAHGDENGQGDDKDYGKEGGIKADDINQASLALREAMIERAITATRQFAKRQVTWLRNWGETGVHNLEASADVKDLAKQVLNLY